MLRSPRFVHGGRNRDCRGRRGHSVNVAQLNRIRLRRFWAIVATLSSFVGNREIKPSNKTKEEIVEGFSLRLITPPRACEPVLEVETDLADSGAQSGSVSSSWLLILPMANCHNFSKSKSLGQGPSTLT